jgi:hypothetical protein
MVSVGSLKFKGVLFVAYSNDHSPRPVHGFAGETEVISIFDWAEASHYRTGTMPSGHRMPSGPT